jgi:hypothetical protein
MVNRRRAMKIGAATVAGVLVNLPALDRDVAPARTHHAFQRAVFDERFAECRAFAAELKSAGVLTSAILGDVAELWYRDLRAQLSKNQTPFAGLTDRPALFCLEELARDVGMRVIARVDHVIDPDGEQNGHAQHTAVGPVSLVAASRQLLTELGFGRTMARLFRRFDLSEPHDTAAQKRTGPFALENKTALVSWIIAGKMIS